MENNKKFVYMFSEEGAADYGYSTAKVTIDGKEQKIKYSAMYESEESASVYKFQDKKMVGQFAHSELRDIKEHDGKYSEIMRKNRETQIKVDSFELPNRLEEKDIPEFEMPTNIESSIQNNIKIKRSRQPLK